MKKIFYITLFMLFTILMVGCDNSKSGKYSFEIVTESVSQLRNSIIFDLKLVDEKDELKNSEVKGQISKKGSSSIITTKTVSFAKSDKTAEVKFTGLDANTEYSVTFYAGYEGKKITLIERDLKTSNEGTVDAPYSIDSYDDFTTIIKKDRNGYFKLVADIDFGGKSISPLFASGSPFTGNLDGNGKTIKNFKLSTIDSENNETHSSSASQYHGLFGYVGEGAKIYNLTLDSFNIMVLRSTSLSVSKTSYYGILAGYCAGEIENVNVTNSTLSVKSNNKSAKTLVVGGLVGNLAVKGSIKSTTEEGSKVDVDVTVFGVYDAIVGGLVGSTEYAERITVKEDDVTVYVPNISKTNYVGDIKVDLSGVNVSESNTSVGGLVGNNYNSTIKDCSTAGKITVTSDFTSVKNYDIIVGGLVGANLSQNSKVSNSTSSMSTFVKTDDIPNKDSLLTVNVGLLVGQNGYLMAKSKVSNCTYTKLEGATHEIHTSENESVKVNAGLIGKVVSDLVDGCKATEALEIINHQYSLNSETNKYDVKSKEIKFSVSAE